MDHHDNRNDAARHDRGSDAAGRATDDVDARRAEGDARGAGDLVGGTAGGVGGTLAGAAIGSLAGPVGTVIGGIAGAVGGWWAGRAIGDAAQDFTDEEDRYYRQHFESPEFRLADRSYEDVRPAYQLGHIAAHNPDYQGRKFEEIEEDLQKGWNDDVRKRHGDWPRIRRYAEASYVRRMYRAPGGPAAMGATSTRPPGL